MKEKIGSVKPSVATVEEVAKAGVRAVEAVKDEAGNVTGFVGEVKHLGGDDSLADINLQSTEPVSPALAPTLAAIRTGKPVLVIHKRE